MQLSATTTVLPVCRYSPSIPVEFSTAIHAAVVARSKGRPVEHYHQAKVAEDVLTTALPALKNGIRRVAARKGDSELIGATTAVQLDGPTAAAVVALWSVRNARHAGVIAILMRRGRHVGFGDTLNALIGGAETKRLMRRVKWHGTIQP